MKAVVSRSLLRSACVYAFFSAIILCALAMPAMAQSTANLNGVVMDPIGAAVPNAKVTATNQATGVSSSSQTDSAGAYLFPSLPIGIYRIEITAPGFEKAVVTDLNLP